MGKKRFEPKSTVCPICHRNFYPTTKWKKAVCPGCYTSPPKRKRGRPKKIKQINNKEHEVISMSKKKKPKIQDLTGGAYQPSEQFKQLPDGTMLRLEDPTTPKTQEELDKEAEDRIDKPKKDESDESE